MIANYRAIRQCVHVGLFHYPGMLIADGSNTSLAVRVYIPNDKI